MRVLLHSSEFPPGPGGIGTQAYELARNLAQMGHAVEVVAPQDYAAPDEIAEFNSSLGFAVRSAARGGGRLAHLGRRQKVLIDALRNYAPDVMLATGDPAIYASAVAALAFPAPWLAVEHGRIPRGAELRIKRWAFARATRAVHVSRYTQSQLHACRVRNRREAVIPNGADAVRFSPWDSERREAARRALGLPAGIGLLTVGNVTARKGQDVVIRAMARVTARRADVHYWIAGLPTLREEFSRLASNLGVAANVHFLGRVSAGRIVELMNCCDLFLMTSRRVADDFEGYGIAAIEAALCGRPAIVSGESGLAEAVVDGVTGLVTPPGDSEAVAAAIMELADSPGRMAELGAAARKRALAELTWPRVAAAYGELLEQMTVQQVRQAAMGRREVA